MADFEEVQRAHNNCKRRLQEAVSECGGRRVNG